MLPGNVKYTDKNMRQYYKTQGCRRRYLFGACLEVKEEYIENLLPLMNQKSCACVKTYYIVEISHIGDEDKLSMVTHGTIGPFQQGKEDWTSYTELCLEQYFGANDVQSAVKQCAILLSSCLVSTYQVIRNLTDRTIKEIVAQVKDHYCPPPSEIVQRFTFNTRSQREGETIAEFVAELRRLSEHCKFADTLDDMLRDRVVCRIRYAHLQRRLAGGIRPNFQESIQNLPVGCE